MCRCLDLGEDLCRFIDRVKNNVQKHIDGTLGLSEEELDAHYALKDMERDWKRSLPRYSKYTLERMFDRVWEVASGGKKSRPAEELRELCDLRELFEQWTEVRRFGAERAMARCPFHDDKHASCSIDKKQGVWLWRCHACSSGGDAFTAIMKRQDVSFPEAVRIIDRIV